MCGLAGLLSLSGQPADPGRLRAMARALAHRGPDDEGIFLDGPIGLAHRRLAILDLTSAGHQPMANEDGTVTVVYNGQLYDFRAVRERLEGLGHRFRSRTDTEILVHLYEERGADLVEEIDGMFAFALWDAPRRRLVLARDRLGIKPLYWIRHGDSIAFASEPAALFALPGFDPGFDLSAVVQYLYQSSVPGSGSVVEGLHQVQPGERLVVDGGAVRSSPYWAPPARTAPQDAGPGGFDDAAVALRARLGEAVRSHLVADVPVGAFLSGGLDSAAVTLEAQRAGSAPLHTFSVRFPGGGGFDEGAAAAETARALGTVHHELTLTEQDAGSLLDVARTAGEPFAIASALPLLHLARFAREHVKVVLTGDGADELLGGYPWRHEPERGPGSRPSALLRRLALTGVRSVRGTRAGGPGLGTQIAGRLERLRHPSEHYAETVSAFTPDEMDWLLAPDLRPLARRAWDAHPVRRAYERSDDADEVNRRLRADLATTLVDEMLVKVDRMTMAAGLEARVPFLDRRLVEWALPLPGAFKIDRGVGKRVLRAALAPVLPAAALRPKHGFDVPVGRWLRGPLREAVGDLLSPGAVARRGWFRAEAVERLLSAHLGGRGDHARKLFTLVALELWVRERESAPSLRPAAAARA